jgi:hypothetical protein
MSSLETQSQTPAEGHGPTVFNSIFSVIIALISAIYLSLFWVQNLSLMPGWLCQARTGVQYSMTRAVNTLAKSLGAAPPGSRWVWAFVSVIMGIILPWVFMAVMGRGRPRDLGLRWPNRIGWRLIAAGYVLALPALLLMASSPAMRAYYRAEVTNNPGGQLVGTYLAVLLAEHFMFHGVLLALLRPTRRWPAVPPPAPVEGTRSSRALRWVGLAQPSSGGASGLSAAAAWLGLPQGCLLATVLQAALFGMVHLGKAPAELAFSFPGGVALAFVAYRCNSLLVPMLLHLATGLTTLALVCLL